MLKITVNNFLHNKGNFFYVSLKTQTTKLISVFKKIQFLLRAFRSKTLRLL